MSAAGKAAKKEKKRPVPVKTSLDTPYSHQWRWLHADLAQLVTNTLTEKMAAIGLWKREEKRFRQWGKKKRTKEPRPAEREPAVPVPGEPPAEREPAVPVPGEPPAEREPAVPVPGEPPAEREHAVPIPGEGGWTDTAARKQLAFGINEVTRALERNELALVLACPSARPSHMTRHLVQLAKSRAVPACQLPRLSACLAPVLGLRCLLALGFRRGAEAFADTVAAIAPLLPSLHEPCPQRAERGAARREDGESREDRGRRGQKQKREEAEGERREDGESRAEGESREEGESRGQKQKREEAEGERREDGENRAEGESREDGGSRGEDGGSREEGGRRGQKRKMQCSPGSAVSLLPLKVKRIVPNPAKVRKPKTKKLKGVYCTGAGVAKWLRQKHNLLQ